MINIDAHREQQGFTLIELILVVLILGVVASISVPYFHTFVTMVEDQVAISDIKDIELELQVYYAEHGKYPGNLGQIGYAGLLDPWGNPYQYLNVSTAKGKGKLRKDHNNVPINTDFDLYSMGPDGKSQSPLTSKSSRDDIVRANDGAFLGTAADY